MDQRGNLLFTKYRFVLLFFCSFGMIAAPVNVAISQISSAINIITLLPYIIRVLFGPLPRSSSPSPSSSTSPVSYPSDTLYIPLYSHFHYRRFRNTNLLHRTGVSIFYYTIRVMFTMIPRYNQNQKVF